MFGIVKIDYYLRLSSIWIKQISGIKSSLFIGQKINHPEIKAVLSKVLRVNHIVKKVGKHWYSSRIEIRSLYLGDMYYFNTRINILIQATNYYYDISFILRYTYGSSGKYRNYTDNSNKRDVGSRWATQKERNSLNNINIGLFLG